MVVTNKIGHCEWSQPKEAVFRAALTALARIKKMSIKTFDENEFTIVAKARMTLFTWGEKVKIHLDTTPDYMTRIRIASENNFGSTAIDWGRNESNIRDIVEEMKKILGDCRGLTITTKTWSDSSMPKPNPNYKGNK